MAKTDVTHSGNNEQLAIEKAKLLLERQRLGVDLLKWCVGGVAVVIGFLLIRPREQDRLDISLKQELFQGYVSSQDTADLQLWQRKLDLMVAFTSTSDKELRKYLDSEQVRLDAIRVEQDEQKQAVNESAALRARIAELSADGIELRAKSSAADVTEQQKEKLEADNANLVAQITDLNSSFAEVSAALAAADANLRKYGFDQEASDLSQLKTSTWETSYIAYNGKTIPAVLTFNGERGTYRSDALVGSLIDVSYRSQGDGFLIQGRWNVSGSTAGYFWFNVTSDMSQFTGEWGEKPDTIMGVWNGTRRLPNRS